MRSFPKTVFPKIIKLDDLISVACCLIFWVLLLSDSFAAPATLSGVVTADRINVRENPDRQSRVITTLQKGTKIEIHNHLGGWYEIMIDGKRGFVSDQLATKTLSEPADEETESQVRSVRKYEQIRQEVQNISKNIKEHEKDLESYTKKETSAAEILNELNVTLNKSRKQALMLKQNIEMIKQKIHETMSAHEELSIKIKNSEEYAGKRVTALYKLENSGRSAFMMSAENIQDWSHRKYLLKTILAHDEKVLKTLQENNKWLEELSQKQKSQYKEKLDLEKKYSEQISSIETEKRKKETLLKDIRSKIEVEIKTLETLKEAAGLLSKTIDKLEDESPSSTSYSRTGENFISSKGLLPYPVKGKIISNYGKHMNNRLGTETFNSGIMIKTERGEPVKSVFSGKVIYSEWYKIYGNTMIINHGDHYYTIYAHMDERLKSNGDRVEKGEVVGTSGDTGTVSDTGLYFEVRHRGKPMDPEEWIKKN